MHDIKGRVALVTGGGRGIGRAIALALASEGAQVAVAARSVPEIEEVAAEIVELGARSIFLPLDVSDRGALATVPARVEKELGPIDILVNNAGIQASAPVQRTDDATWDAMLAVNLTAPFLLSRACLPSMYGRGFGRILNVASVGAKMGLRYAAAYVASKHGLVGLTRTLALEGAKKGVTANALCPGWTETQMMDDAVQALSEATGRTLSEAREAVLGSSPLGRAVLPDEVAAIAVAILRNAAVTGQAIHVDGGELMA